MHYVNPSRENFDAFKALPRDEPIHMLNFIRYRPLAAYPDGHPNAALGWSGQRAYREYIAAIQPVLARVGGKMVWEARYQCTVTGPAEPEWDEIFVMGYPNAAAFMAMVKDPGYSGDVVVHREAAVLDSRLMRFTPQV